MNPSTLLRPCAVAAIALLAACAVQAAPAYHLVDLGPNSEAYGINRDGVVAGSVSRNPGFYTDSAWKTVYQTISGNARAVAIDNHGDTVGTTFPHEGAITADYWKNGTKATTLPLGDYEYQEATSIAPDGSLIVGFGRDASNIGRCFTWTPGAASVTDLGLTNCTTSAVNSKGQISGTAELGTDGTVHGFVYANGQVTDLGSFEHTSRPFTSSAKGMNAKGHVTGGTPLPSGDQQAFLWNGKRLINLGSLGSTFSAGTALNDNDDVVGIAADAQGVNRMFLYTGGQMLELDTLIDNTDGWYELFTPVAIDNDGVIVGNGFVGTAAPFVEHAYMLVPITN